MKTETKRTLVDLAISLVLTAAVLLNADLITGSVNEASANMPPDPECGGPM